MFAGHRIEGVAGRGGMGVVYRATDLTLDRRVALKLIAPERRGRRRSSAPASSASAGSPPRSSIRTSCPIYHAGQEGDRLYVTMRFIDGHRPAGAARRGGPARPASTPWRSIAQVAEALDEAHRRGLVHRDVKPGNILIERDGAASARTSPTSASPSSARPATELTRTGMAVGTADYMAPEQARGGDVDGRADVYALGCVLFRALTGEVVFDRDSDLDKLWAHVHEPPPALLDVRPELPRRARRRGRARAGQGARRAPADRGRARAAKPGRRSAAMMSPGAPGSLAWLGGPLIGIANGTLRELAYKDRVGELTAHQLSTGSAIALFAGYFELLARRRPLTSTREALEVGIAWLALTVAFEFGFGRGVAHTSWDELLADYDLRKGRLWPLVLAWIALGPAIVRARRCGKPTA